jgi:16S rRNA (guanine527-N7)-methyltransferase
VISDDAAQSVDITRELYGAGFPSLNRYVDILSTTAVEWGLLGPREADRLWDRHILNSAALSELIPSNSSVADVGSGAGLPGIPVALLRPDLEVTLVEPLLRRSTFLTQTVEALGIEDRVQVVRSRAEDHSQRYDVVVSRAVAPLDRLIGWCNRLRAADGVILALKGSSAADEVGAARHELKSARLTAEVFSVKVHPDAEPATVVRLRSLGAGTALGRP